MINEEKEWLTKQENESTYSNFIISFSKKYISYIKVVKLEKRFCFFFSSINNKNKIKIKRKFGVSIFWK